MNEAIAELFASIMALVHLFAAYTIITFSVPPEWIQGAWNVWTIKLAMAVIYVACAGLIATLIDIADNVRRLREGQDAEFKRRIIEKLDRVDGHIHDIEAKVKGLKP